MAKINKNVWSWVVMASVMVISQQAYSRTMSSSGTTLVSAAKSRILFCSEIETRINSLGEVEDKFAAFAIKQTDVSATGFDSVICLDAINLHLAACDARKKAEQYRDDHCGSTTSGGTSDGDYTADSSSASDSRDMLCTSSESKKILCE